MRLKSVSFVLLFSIASLLGWESLGFATSGIDRQLIQAAKRGELQRVHKLLERWPSLHAKDRDRRTALHWAAQNGHAAIVRVLINAGASIHAIGLMGYRPLHFAAQFGHIDTVEILINARANLRAQTIVGDTPLHLAAGHGHTAIVERLIAARANLHAADQSGYTPLHLAAGRGRTAIVERLIDAGANFQAQTSNGDTPLHLAAMHGHSATVEKLILMGAIVNLQNNYRNSALHLAAIAGRFSTAKILIKFGADDGALNNERKTPLILVQENYNHQRESDYNQTIETLNNPDQFRNTPEIRTFVKIQKDAKSAASRITSKRDVKPLIEKALIELSGLYCEVFIKQFCVGAKEGLTIPLLKYPHKPWIKLKNARPILEHLRAIYESSFLDATSLAHQSIEKRVADLVHRINSPSTD
jgi:ankyrin repeat protein